MTNYEGKLLITPPTVKGNYWSKSIVMVTEDLNSGSVGLMLNRKSKLTLREFGRQCSVNLDFDDYLYVGGPVNTKALTLLHSDEWECSNTLNIGNGFSISSSTNLLELLSNGNEPEYWKMFVGLCSWNRGQLDAEIKGLQPFSHNYSWLIATPNYELVYHTDIADQWSNAIELSGSEFVQTCLA